MACRTKKIGHVYGIYTLYQTGKLSPEPLLPIEEVEERIRTKYYGNEVPTSLSPSLPPSLSLWLSPPSLPPSL
jgi:hypothetical protein